MAQEERFQDRYSLERAQGLVFDFESLMSEHGIKIRRGSALEQAALSIFEVIYRQQDRRAFQQYSDIRLAFRHLIGLTELGSFLLAVRSHPDFTKLLHHLRLLNEGMPLQNTPSKKMDDAANKVFELFMATLAMRCGSGIELDHPEHSKGDNPDILATINGRRWGIACKAIQSSNPESFVQNLEKGIAQIERSPAEVGIVAFNLKNVLEHDKYWSIMNLEEYLEGAEPLFSCFHDPGIPVQTLRNDTREFGAQLLNHVGIDYLTSIFDSKKSVPGYLLWAHTAAGVLLQGKPVPASIRAMDLQEVGTLEAADVEAIECLHGAIFGNPHKEEVIEKPVNWAIRSNC